MAGVVFQQVSYFSSYRMVAGVGFGIGRLPCVFGFSYVLCIKPYIKSTTPAKNSVQKGAGWIPFFLYPKNPKTTPNPTNIKNSQNATYM